MFTWGSLMDPNDRSLYFLNMFFIVFMLFFLLVHFDCGYSSDDVLLKSHAAANCIYSVNAKHGSLSEYTSSTTPNWLKLCCIALITVSFVLCYYDYTDQQLFLPWSCWYLVADKRLLWLCNSVGNEQVTILYYSFNCLYWA